MHNNDYAHLIVHQMKAADYQAELADLRLARSARAGQPGWWQRLLTRLRTPRPAPAAATATRPSTIEPRLSVRHGTMTA